MPAGELKTFLNLFGVPGFAILYMIFFAILKDETGKPACDLVRAYKDNLGFEMIALIAITIPLPGKYGTLPPDVITPTTTKA